jgi:hypothetical protein
MGLVMERERPKRPPRLAQIQQWAAKQHWIFEMCIEAGNFIVARRFLESAGLQLLRPKLLDSGDLQHQYNIRVRIAPRLTIHKCRKE